MLFLVACKDESKMTLVLLIKAYISQTLTIYYFQMLAIFEGIHLVDVGVPS